MWWDADVNGLQAALIQGDIIRHHAPQRVDDGGAGDCWRRIQVANDL